MYNFVIIWLIAITTFPIKKNLVISYKIGVIRLIIGPTNAERPTNKKKLAGIKGPVGAKGPAGTEGLIIICYNHQY